MIWLSRGGRLGVCYTGPVAYRPPQRSEARLRFRAVLAKPISPPSRRRLQPSVPYDDECDVLPFGEMSLYVLDSATTRCCTTCRLRLDVCICADAPRLDV